VNRHDENGLIFLELQNHFIEKAQNPELIHVFDVEVNLFKVFFIKDELILVEAEYVLRGEDNFRERGF